ncbi:MAG TPA: shikimate dehydrogenase [Candidatus Omnitrophota bacterium]|nr:shikimate dehydrogenase [Candidatus Omnitrophota bacterium]
MKKRKTFQLYGIFGYPLSHTLSPAMHEAAFGKLGIDADYIVVELEPSAFRKTMRQASQLLLAGFNVTVPYKETVMKYLDHISAEAKAIGAVNTVYRQGKRWVGTNTDMPGFLMTLKRDGAFRPSRKKAVVLGAGGAARALVYGLSLEGIREVLLTDCFPEKAEKIVREMRKIFPKIHYQAVKADIPEVKGAIQKADVIINATPLGLKAKDPLVIPKDWIPQAGSRKKLLMDLIYNPAVTPFLKAAKEKGHRTLNGLGMLLYQGVLAFEQWTKQKAPVAVMRQALLTALKGTGK